MASSSSLSADLGPAGAIECLNFTGVFFTTSWISSNSSLDFSTKLLFISDGFRMPLASALALTTPWMLGVAEALELEEPTLAVWAAVGR